MGRVKTFTNGGNLLPGDLNAIEDDYEFTFSTYKTILDRGLGISATTPAGAYWLEYGQTSDAFNYRTGGGTFYFAPGDYTAGSRTTKLRIRAQCSVLGSTAPACNFAIGMYAVSAGSTSGAQFGGLITFNTPGANSNNQSVTSDFTAPTAGFYALIVTTSASIATGAQAELWAALQLRQT